MPVHVATDLTPEQIRAYRLADNKTNELAEWDSELLALLLDAWFGNIARVLDPGRALYCWGGYANCGNYPPVLKRHGLYFGQAIIWNKLHPVLTRKDFMGAHEWCFYCWREGAAHVYPGRSSSRCWPELDPSSDSPAAGAKCLDNYPAENRSSARHGLTVRGILGPTLEPPTLHEPDDARP